MSSSPIEPRTIPAEAKERLRIMFIAKHAKWPGGLHPEDGNHALYHVETRAVLESLGLNLVLENRYEALFEKRADQCRAAGRRQPGVLFQRGQ